MAHLKLENNPVSPISQAIFDNTQKTLGFVPNMYKGMGQNPALLDIYIYGYNSFRANSGFNSVEQEVVFLSVAYENNCEYCTSAHSFIADKMSKVPTEVTNAIRDGKEVPDLKLAALSKLTRSLTANRGNVAQEEVDAFLAAGYTETHVLGIIAGIAVKTISNYSNHNTNPELDDAFAGRAWKK
ncbi:carboxymuconolactone decarboxylase family protein [Flavobacterium sp. LS1P28]|uniref:carboxymuconolactone decarboxylase family protein n=1 Tax=unclassified Flavobacterium TaxID=196869 RepID=UPI000F8237FD|nr:MULTISPECIES: carboxymuconolactone decarboxylase family protein [unclassified Flavobacterium]RTY80552.1 carboxymuconolactone decarboxylase family protein [Flavobacterium sp. LS1P28]RTY83881.1 carboxymuconolactone decarboxylase family protein [Flavobacterium sp. ZB4P23]